MAFKGTLAVVLLLQIFTQALAQAAPQPTANLGYSQYAGTFLSSGVSQFLGLRFAKPPTGDLRFAAPQPPESTDGVLQATEHGPVCLAGRVPSNAIFGDSEDCLFADIYTPAFDVDDDGCPKLNKTKLPVFVWIAGGGYIQLYNSNYNGTYLVEYSGNDIIVVTFNYRVGAFGFLAGEEVASGGALNAGLLDQRFFFEWVKQNIEQFGGDPDHVVLDGTSAGAGSLLHHLTAYGGRNDNLFHAGISDSLYTPFQPECSYYQYQYDAITDATGCASSPDTLACLRSLDSTTFNNANVGYPYPNRPIASNNTSAYTASAGVFPYGPCIDGDLIPESTNSLLAEGKFLKLPLLLGNDNDEGTILVPDASTSDDVDAFFADNYPLLTLDEVQSISSSEYAYLAGVPTPLHGPYFSLLANAYDESTFTCPSNNLASIYANGAVPVWNYRYAVLAPSNAAAGIGTPHTYQDIAYWGPGDADYTKFPTYDADNAAVLPLVRGYWTSFVKTYDPNAQAAPGAPTWGQYGSAQNRILFNNLGASMENVPADENARCAYWHDQLGPHLAQ